MVEYHEIPANFQIPDDEEELESQIVEHTIEDAPETTTAPAVVHTGATEPAEPQRGEPFQNRQYGWERISVPISEQNVIAALDGAGLNWSVLPRPVMVDGHIVEGRIANVRSDLPPGRNVLEIVGSKYHIVQNRDALAFVQDVLAMGDVELVRAGSFNNGRTVFLQGSTDNIVVGGDEIEPYIVFSNSHDGTTAVRVAITAVRASSKSTLSLALAEAPRIWSVIHTKSVEGRMRAARESMSFIRDYLTELPLMIQRMQETKITEAQFTKIVNTLFPVPVSTDKNRTAVTNASAQAAAFTAAYRYTPGNEPWVGSAWGAYNAYADFESHSEPLRTSQRFDENRFARNVAGRKLERAQKVIMQIAGSA